jgi:proteasome lid subunit RPN8/RPN11
MDTLSRAITIRKKHWDQMLSDAETRLPDEACGIVAGKDRSSVRVYPVTNILQSSTRFRFDPHQQLEAMLLIEEQGWEMMAIYHSHPAGPSHPSVTDIKESAYPETVNLIWYPEQGEWHCRGYIIKASHIEEVPLDIHGE